MTSDKPRFIDTHCHIHDSAFSGKFEGKSPASLFSEAKQCGVEKLICVGTDLASSIEAVALSWDNKDCFASIAYHPHEAEKMQLKDIAVCQQELRTLIIKAREKAGSQERGRVVAIGECGLDYFYHSKPHVRELQRQLLKAHIAVSLEFSVPMIFHVREAFSDFFAVLDQYPLAQNSRAPIRGVVHSFSANIEQLHGVLERGLYVGLNGIMTFTKDENQLAAAKAVPLERLVLETDAPFLTPVPFRGKMCEPKHVVRVAEFLSELRGESLEEIAKATTTNAQRLFDI